MRPVLLWFRDALRLDDNPALGAALATDTPIIPVYVLDEASHGAWALGGASRWWLHHSLLALSESLRMRGASLLLRRGDSARVVESLAIQLNVSEILTTESVTPSDRYIDARIIKSLGANRVRRMPSSLLFDPARVRTRSGAPFQVFTPFARACHELDQRGFLASAPERIPSIPVSGGERLEDWNLLPSRPDWAGGLRAAWVPGESGARARLRQFLDSGLDGYATARDRMDVDGTSTLAPHLRFGELAPARVWHAAQGRPGADAFLRELLWREFAGHLLWHFPSMPTSPLRAGFDAIPWRDAPDEWHAWCQGRTGIPIVDAGMRQLWRTGWMHNRARMITASFLVKHLLIDWRQGEAWFWDTLVDADLANNAMNWQWVAGCGADAAPYFRVFNPVLQGRKFDPDGEYVRRFVPELRRLDTRFIHAPWEAPPQALLFAGITLGRDYPMPIVDLAAGRARALAAMNGRDKVER